ncbi:hypothetical protein pb186bvf_012747 [Paramecium bursaria]
MLIHQFLFMSVQAMCSIHPFYILIIATQLFRYLQQKKIF